jgi:hypothetical protein
VGASGTCGDLHHRPLARHRADRRALLGPRVGPLAWTHAHHLRLAWDLQDGKVTEMPDVVAERYANTK